MHEELEFHLSYLADQDYQERAWVGGDYGTDNVTFDDIVHFILDDAELDRDEDDHVGWFIRDANEAEYVRAAAKAVLAVLKTYGGSLTDAQYIAKPEWQHVLDTAKAALAAVRATDPP